MPIETPSGTVDGANASFSLSASPGGDVLLYTNGVLQESGFNYSRSDRTITFLAGSIPQTNDRLLAIYGSSLATGLGGGSTTTAADIIRRALKLLGLLAAGEPLGADDQADGLVELNNLLGSWANEKLMVLGVRRSTYALTPSLSPHTIGIGGTLNTTRPLRIDGAGLIPAGLTTELPLVILTDVQYRETLQKDLTSDIPSRLWVEWTYPTANLWLWPVPTAAATLVLYTWSRISTFTASDTVSLPEGYENALGHALALQIAPLYGEEPSARLEKNAEESLASIKRTNMQTPISEVDPALVGPGRFNIYTG